MSSRRNPKKGGASKAPYKSKKPDESSCSLFNVEEITGSRFVNGKVEMQVKWTDYPPEMSSWEPLENLSTCMKLVFEFEEELSRMIKMANITTDLQPSSDSKKEVDKNPSEIKASPTPSPGELQLETGKPTGPKPKAKNTSSPQPNAGPNSDDNQKENIPSKLLPDLIVEISDDETPSFSFGKCASPTPADGEKSSGSSISSTTKKAKPLKGEKKRKTRKSQAKQKGPKVQTVVKASKKGKKSTKEIQKIESSDDDSDTPLMTPYPTVFGLARGLELDKVVHSFRVGDRHFLFVTWQGMDVVDTVPLEELKETYPAKVLQYFEKLERRY